MKQWFEALDGKMFEEEGLAKSYEEKLQKNVINPRLVKLAKEKVFSEFKDGDILEVGCNFDAGGNSQGRDRISGSKEKVMQYLAARGKYWNIGDQLEIQICKVIKL